MYMYIHTDNIYIPLHVFHFRLPAIALCNGKVFCKPKTYTLSPTHVP